MPWSHSLAVLRESSADGGSDLSGHSDEEFGDSAVYLFPVLAFFPHSFVHYHTVLS